MKKLISFILVTALLLCVAPAALAARVGDVVGKVYSTDILAYVDGHAVTSYNIGGYTCVCVEDLMQYGFDVVWYAAERKLTCDSAGEPNTYPADVSRGTLGRITGKVYYTDIKTYVNGIEAPSYNIGGRTCVCVETLGDVSQGGSYGWSKYAMKCEWDAADRKVSLTALHDSFLTALPAGYDYEITDTGLGYAAMTLTFNGADDGLRSGAASRKDNGVKPIYISGADGVDTGLQVGWLFPDGVSLDSAALSRAVEAGYASYPTREERVAGYESDPIIEVLQKFETDECTVLYMGTRGTMHPSKALMVIRADGTWTDVLNSVPRRYGGTSDGVSDLTMSEDGKTLTFTAIINGLGYTVSLPDGTAKADAITLWSIAAHTEPQGYSGALRGFACAYDYVNQKPQLYSSAGGFEAVTGPTVYANADGDVCIEISFYQNQLDMTAEHALLDALNAAVTVRYGETVSDADARREVLGKLVNITLTRNNRAEKCAVEDLIYSQGNGHSDYTFVLDTGYFSADLLQAMSLQIGEM